MPGLPVFKFHTNTIQSILDPVAAQVSQLVILHEEAENGRIVPDLGPPVMAVGAAVTNLVMVGKQTVETTKDEQLKKDMPPTFETTELATKTLIEASTGLREQPELKANRMLLLDGARGILTGVSGLLLVFDQSEVRKIVKTCKQIIDYLPVAEVVQTMEELTTYTKNLAPGMTNMSKMVDGRAEDLTNVSHKDILVAESDQTKRAVPLLLSSMKAFVSLKVANKKGDADAQENRNYIVLAMTESIKEVIRVLQLTSPTEEEGALASSTGAGMGGLPGGLLAGTFTAKVFQAKELLSQAGTDPEINKKSLEAVVAVLSNARRIAKTFSPEKKAVVEAICSEIETLMRELAELQANGQGDSERARELRALISAKMDQLEREIQFEITKKVAEDFKDPLGPLNALTTAALASLDTANREENYQKKSADFEAHSKKMAATAAALAKSGVVTDRKLADALISTSRKVKALAPQVMHASKIVFENPDSEAAREHYQLLKEDYQRQVEKLTKLVDSGVDPVLFIAASEEQLKDDLNKAKELTRAQSQPQQAFAHIASAARTANRVVAITKNEAENSLDPEFKSSLERGMDAVTKSIAPVVTSARATISQHSQPAQETFEMKADNLVSAVHDVFDVVDTQYNPPPPPPRPPSPEPEAEPAVPPRPPSPVEEAPDQTNNPIGYAAHQLDKDAKQWEGNQMVDAARRMAKLMMEMAKFTSGEGSELHSKKELIQTARMIAKESEEVVKMAKKIADACTDKRMKRSILQVVDKIPMIATQLKIIATVKATRQGGNDPEADQEASEMLTNNAQNLMGAVSEVLYATEAATIRVPPAKREELGLQWVKRR